MPLATIEEAIADIRAGKMVIVMDDEDRENEGDSPWPPRWSHLKPSTS